MTNPQHSIIVGGGIGGLALAGLLARAGRQVSLYEARDQLGGRAGRLEAGGFSFDTGPSWYLMPDVYERFFDLMGHRPDDYYQLDKLTPAYKLFFESEPHSLTITGDEQLDAATFDSLEPGAGKQLGTYLDSAERMYRTSMEHFLYSRSRISDFAKPMMLRQAPELLRLVSQPIDSYVSRRFSNPKLRQILEYPAVFLGSSPFSAPALYHLMSYLDFRQGVYYPRGGMYRIVEALRDMALEAGAELHTASPVQSIAVSDGRVQGVYLEDGSLQPADTVISNADLHYTQTELLAEPYRDYPASYWQRKQAGPSALLLYIGLRGACPELEHHNLLFADDWRGNFEAIFTTQTWPDPASMYVCRSSASDPACAPPGHENIFVLVPLPAKTDLTQQDIDQHTGRYLDQLAAMAGIPDLRQRIVFQQAYTPQDFQTQLHAWNGTALGLSHRLTQSALFRPGIASRKVDGLYYVGANVQPGIGVPMCLISAELAASRITGRSYPRASDGWPATRETA